MRPGVVPTPTAAASGNCKSCPRSGHHPSVPRLPAGAARRGAKPRRRIAGAAAAHRPAPEGARRGSLGGELDQELSTEQRRLDIARRTRRQSPSGNGPMQFDLREYGVQPFRARFRPTSATSRLCGAKPNLAEQGSVRPHRWPDRQVRLQNIRSKTSPKPPPQLRRPDLICRHGGDPARRPAGHPFLNPAPKTCSQRQSQDRRLCRSGLLGELSSGRIGAAQQRRARQLELHLHNLKVLRRLEALPDCTVTPVEDRRGAPVAGVPPDGRPAKVAGRGRTAPRPSAAGQSRTDPQPGPRDQESARRHPRARPSCSTRSSTTRSCANIHAGHHRRGRPPAGPDEPPADLALHDAARPAQSARRVRTGAPPDQGRVSSIEVRDYDTSLRHRRPGAAHPGRPSTSCATQCPGGCGGEILLRTRAARSRWPSAIKRLAGASR